MSVGFVDVGSLTQFVLQHSIAAMQLPCKLVIPMKGKVDGLVYVCWSVFCLSVCLFACLSVSLSLCLFVRLSVHLSLCLSICLSVCLFVCLLSF